MTTQPEPSGALTAQVEIGTYPKPTFEEALEVVLTSVEDQRIQAIRALMSGLFDEVRPLNPITDEHGKYLNLEVSAHGYSESWSLDFSVYFGERLHIKGIENFATIREALNKFDPEVVKAEQISKLRAELTKLEKGEA